MSIWVNEKTKIVVQGLTGAQGAFHAKSCHEYHQQQEQQNAMRAVAQVVAGVTPGKGGLKHEGFPVFDTVRDSVRATGANASLIFVPASGAADAILEAEDAGIELIVCITEGIPVRDMLAVKRVMIHSKSRLIGPNCPGIITPGLCKMGIMPGFIHTAVRSVKKGGVGVISRSGTLTYEAVAQLTALGIPQTTCVGIGGDPIPGTHFVDVLKAFAEDTQTHGVIMIGEIGGSAEEEAAEYIKARFSKPVAAFIAGAAAPEGRRMGHAGAIVAGGKGTAAAKIEALSMAGAVIAATPSELGLALQKALGSHADFG